MRMGTRLQHKQGADVNFQGGKKNWSAMHFAVRRSQMPAIETMLEFGADTNAKGADGQSPLHIAETRWAEV